MVDLKAVNLSGDREAVNPAKPGTRAVSVLLYAARDEFPASRGVLSLTYPEAVGGNEVKQS
jgi:hypothetical protein